MGILLAAPSPQPTHASTQHAVLLTQRLQQEGGKPGHLYSSRCVVPEVPGRWIKRTGESLVPKALCRNCPDDDPLVGPILAVVAKAGGALAGVPRPSSRVDVEEEEEEGDEAEAGETTKGTFRVCIIIAP
uniref:Uncharacterized protein n=2 Tax=Canis lupus TaxID=9612 RepID=A0A8C0NRY1_CANLF